MIEPGQAITIVARVLATIGLCGLIIALLAIAAYRRPNSLLDGRRYACYPASIEKESQADKGQ